MGQMILDVIAPSELSDEMTIRAAGSERFGTFYPLDFWDDGYGKVYGYAEVFGIRGIARAQTWETAYECVIDEIQDDADPDTLAEFLRENPGADESGDLPEGCHYRSNGIPSNPRLTSDIASEDLNGSRLEPLPDQDADDRRYWLIVEREICEQCEKLPATGVYQDPDPDSRYRAPINVCDACGEGMRATDAMLAAEAAARGDD